MRTNANLNRRLAAAEIRLSPPTRIIVARDNADADRISATEIGNFLIVITGVPRRG